MKRPKMAEKQTDNAQPFESVAEALHLRQLVIGRYRDRSRISGEGSNLIRRGVGGGVIRQHTAV